jgi:hypothetical protein
MGIRRPTGMVSGNPKPVAHATPGGPASEQLAPRFWVAVRLRFLGLGRSPQTRRFSGFSTALHEGL